MRWTAVGVSLSLVGLVGCSSFVGAEETSSSEGTTTENATGGPGGGSDPTAATSGSPTSTPTTSGAPTSGDPTTNEDPTDDTTEDPTDDTDPSDTDPSDGESSSTGPAPETCDNGEQDRNETDVDCGGPCPRCDLGGGCGSASDCTSGFCGLDSTCDNQTPIVWLDALDAGSMYSDDACETSPPTAGQQVYCWQNKGSFDVMFIDQGGQPIYREALDGLEFQDDPLVSEMDIFGGDLGDVTVFIVQEETGSRNSWDFNLNHPATDNDRYAAAVPWGNSSRAVSWDIGGGGMMESIETAEDIVEVEDVHQFTFVNSAEEDARAIRIDGEDAANGAGALTHTAGSVSLGVNARTVLYEFRVYVPSPSPQHRDVIEGQLACKWGLRDLLPEEHPFHSADADDQAGCPAEL